MMHFMIIKPVRNTDIHLTVTSTCDWKSSLIPRENTEITHFSLPLTFRITSTKITKLLCSFVYDFV